MTRKRVLIVHGYKLIDPAKHLEHVCRAAFTIHDSYARIFLLGGGPSGQKSTIPGVMRNVLVKFGVPSGKIYDTSKVPLLKNHEHPLDTVQEVELMLRLQRCCGWRDFEYDVLAVAAWLPRIRRIHRSVGAECDRIIPVDVPVPLLQMGMERALRLLSNYDPLGKGVITGLPHRIIRRSRS